MKTRTIEVMIDAAKKAGTHLIKLSHSLGDLEIETKSKADFVTNADKEAERILYESLSTSFPDASFLMEESGEVEGKGKDFHFYIDPLDATTNYLKGIPLWGVSIALKQSDDVIAGVIHLPVLQEIFSAEKGKGAFLNGQPIHVSSCSRLDKAVIATGLHCRNGASTPQWLAERAERIIKDTSGIRRAGCTSADLAFVAAGRYDGYYERGSKPWDLAAGTLLIREAGGQVTDLSGEGDPVETGNIVATNGKLHIPLTNLIR